ncbi:MAG TPA: hypothetical protein VHO01_12880, partial [Jatrophihabitans sp.]|nr:hypothetical protein [Jatrophihabitans sp.]
MRTVCGDHDRHLVGASLMFTLPGVPMILAGAEIGMTDLGTGQRVQLSASPAVRRGGWTVRRRGGWTVRRRGGWTVRRRGGWTVRRRGGRPAHRSG